MAFDLHDDENVDLTVSYVDRAGNPATAPEGASLTATSSDEAVVTASVSGDVVTVTTVGALGAATVTVSNGSLSASEDINVVAGPAASLAVAPGTPVARDLGTPAAAAPADAASAPVDASATPVDDGTAPPAPTV